MWDSGVGFNIGRFWMSLFYYEEFTGIRFECGYNEGTDCFVIFHLHILWISFIVAIDKA